MPEAGMGVIVISFVYFVYDLFSNFCHFFRKKDRLLIDEENLFPGLDYKNLI